MHMVATYICLFSYEGILYSAYVESRSHNRLFSLDRDYELTRLSRRSTVELGHGQGRTTAERRVNKKTEIYQAKTRIDATYTHMKFPG